MEIKRTLPMYPKYDSMERESYFAKNECHKSLKMPRELMERL